MPSYEDIVESLEEGLVCADLSSILCAMNQGAERLLEVSRTHSLDRSMEVALPGAKGVCALLEKTLSDASVNFDKETTVVRRFSGPTTIRVTTQPVFSPSGELSGAMALMKDLTGIKAIEHSGASKERLALIGSIAANLAHEIKNPLGGIRGAAQLLTRRVKDKKLSEYADIIVKETDRLDSIVCGLLGLSKGARPKKKAINVHRALDSVILMQKRCALPGVAITKEYDPSIPPVAGDEAQLTQVFLNIIKNGVESLGKKGSVRVTTRMVTDFHLVERGESSRMLAIEFKDTGSGIKQADIDKVYTPFFTTKPEGTGLGLPISLKIVKAHNGFLQMESDGRGTKVTVYLPVAG